MRSSASRAATRRRRSDPLRGRKPSTTKRSVGRPLTVSAATTDEGPGTVVTTSPCAARRAATSAPGSEIPGVPASLTTATRAPAATAAAIRSAPAASLWRCNDTSRSPAPMPRAESRARVRRVSSQKMSVASARTWRARGARSPRLPIGVATSTRRPVRPRPGSRRAVRARPRLAQLELVAHPRRSSARGSPRPWPRRSGCLEPPRASRHGLRWATRSTV